MGRIDSVPNGVSGTFFCLGMRRSQKNCSFLLAPQKSNYDYLVNLVKKYMVSPSGKTELSSYFSALVTFLPLLSPLIQSPDKTVAHKPLVSGQFRDGHQRGKEFRNSSTNTVQKASSIALSSDFKATQKKKDSYSEISKTSEAFGKNKA